VTITHKDNAKVMHVHSAADMRSLEAGGHGHEH